MITQRLQHSTERGCAPSRRTVALGAILWSLFPIPDRKKVTIPVCERIVIRNGWILLESDLS